MDLNGIYVENVLADQAEVVEENTLDSAELESELEAIHNQQREVWTWRNFRDR